MTIDFALISAECDLRDLYTCTTAEVAEANAWFDAIEAEFAEIEAAWDRLAASVDCGTL
jgi:hypothetical protein